MGVKPLLGTPISFAHRTDKDLDKNVNKAFKLLSFQNPYTVAMTSQDGRKNERKNYTSQNNLLLMFFHIYIFSCRHRIEVVYVAHTCTCVDLGWLFWRSFRSCMLIFGGEMLMFLFFFSLFSWFIWIYWLDDILLYNHLIVCHIAILMKYRWISGYVDIIF